MTFSQSAVRLSGLTAVALGWVPDVFWGATPDELAAILNAMRSDGAGAVAPPDGATMRQLMERYPDG